MGCMHGFFQFFNRRQTSTGNKFHTAKRNTSPTVDDEDKKNSRTSTFIATLMCLTSPRHTDAHVSGSEKSESSPLSPKSTHALSLSDWKEGTFVNTEDDCQTEVSECFSFRVSNGELIKVDNGLVELLETDDHKIKKIVAPENDCQTKVSECFSFRVSNGELIKGGDEFVELMKTDDHKIKKIVPPSPQRLIEPRSPFLFKTISKRKHAINTRLHNDGPGIPFPWPEAVTMKFRTKNPGSRATKPSPVIAKNDYKRFLPVLVRRQIDMDIHRPTRL